MGPSRARLGPSSTRFVGGSARRRNEIASLASSGPGVGSVGVHMGALRTTIFGASFALLGLVALAGCGDTTSDEGAAGTSAEACANGGETVTVDIPEFTFSPTPVKVGRCDSVVWKNTHTQPHTATGNGDKTWTTGNLAPDATSDPVSFEETGSFAYICALHPFMKGVVEVS